MKILIVLNDSPLPFLGAASRWYFIMVKKLIDRGHQIKILIATKDESKKAEVLSYFPMAEFFMHEKKSKMETLLKPFSYSFSKKLKLRIKAIREEGIDIVHIEQPFTAYALEDDFSKSVLSVHYLASIDMQSVNYFNLKDYLLAYLMQKTEKKLINKFHYIKSCSLPIENEIRKWNKELKNYYHFPFAIDVNNYEYLPQNSRAIGNNIVLIASMNWYPGKSAAIRLLERIYPKLKARIPELKLQIVGWEARKMLADFLHFPDVEILENVPDIIPYFKNARYLIYTPDKGSGMKIKIIEAMLYGTPVITTTDGVEGLDAISGKHALISDDDETLIEMASNLFSDVELQEKLRKNARKLIEVNCEGEKIITQLESIYTDIANGK